MLDHEEAWDAFCNSHPLGYQKATIIREVKAMLGAAPDTTFSTNDVAQAIYPPRYRRGEAGKAIVKRVYSLLSTLADTELSAFNVQGERVVRKRFGGDRVERPRVWRFAHTDERADMRKEAAEPEEVAVAPKPEELKASAKRLLSVREAVLEATDFADLQRLVRESV